MSCERVEVEASPEVVAAWQSHFAAERAVEYDRNAMTAAELATAVGVSESVMRSRLQAGLKSGKYTKEKAHRLRGDGQRMIVTVYRLVEQQKAGSKSVQRRKKR